MSPEAVIEIGASAMRVAMILAAPVLIVTLVVGLLISILQAATQIQEMTITFVPKIIAVAIVLLILGPWMINLMVSYTVQLFSNIPYFIR